MLCTLLFVWNRGVFTIREIKDTWLVTVLSPLSQVTTTRGLVALPRQVLGLLLLWST